jgi:hypothetical protein
MHRLKWAVAVGAVAALAVATPASAGTLDQQQTMNNGGSFLGPNNIASQSFTAGLTGTLDQVDIYVLRTGTLSDLTVEIYPVADGCPTGEPLASAVVPEASVPRDSVLRWTSVRFEPGPEVVAGTEYAIVVSATTTSYVWARESDSDAYPRGSACHATADMPTVWTPSASGSDYTFKTYVVEPPPQVDADAPETEIVRVAKHANRGTVRFWFGADEAGAAFECRLRGRHLDPLLKQFNRCRSSRRYRWLDHGRFKFEVRAIDAAGNVDPTADKARFRVV